VAFHAAPTFLGTILPRYVEGLPALRPLLPGMLLLGLAWPARQMLITVERPYRLALATLAGLAVTAAAGAVGADQAGIVGVAWGMTAGYSAVFLLTSATAFVPFVGLRGWAGHLLRIGAMIAWMAAGVTLVAPLGAGFGPWTCLVLRLGPLIPWVAAPIGLRAWRVSRG
jgi:O-antigen/teichoic acid export membrane protein